MTEHHIQRAFDRDLEAMQALIMRMGGLVEDEIREATRALIERDLELAAKVRADDKAVDALEQQVNEAAARIIALRAPAASDLRTVLSSMKIATALERCGDYAKNLAKRTSVLAEMPPIEGADQALARMAREVELMLKDALDAYARRDAALAREVRARDAEVDQMYNALFRQFITYMMEDPRNITACMHLHFIAKNLERIGDLVTNIAEQTVYLVTGEIPEEPRPKEDWVEVARDAAGVEGGRHRR